MRKEFISFSCLLYCWSLTPPQYNNVCFFYWVETQATGQHKTLFCVVLVDFLVISITIWFLFQILLKRVWSIFNLRVVRPIFIWEVLVNYTNSKCAMRNNLEQFVIWIKGPKLINLWEKVRSGIESFPIWKFGCRFLCIV